jgi:hypothetical protein
MGNLERLAKAEEEEREAADEVQKLVNPFLRVADLLRDWKTVSFTGVLADGTHTVPAGGEDEKTIGLNDLPTLESICDAIGEWHEAQFKVQHAMNSLTDQEREMLHRG